MIKRSLRAAALFMCRFRALGIFIAFSPSFAEKLDALRPRYWARALDLGGDVVSHRIDLIGLQRRRGTNWLEIAEIRGSHVVAALVGIGEPVEMRHRRSRTSTLYDLTDLISGELRLAQRGRV